MSPIHRVSAALRIFGDELDPDEITRLLGKAPSQVQRRGRPLQLPSGREGRIIDFSSWTIAAEETSPGDLDAQIEQILQGTTVDLAVWAHIASAFRMDLFCGFFMRDNPEEIGLSPRSLLALGQWRIKLSLDIYGPTRTKSEFGPMGS